MHLLTAGSIWFFVGLILLVRGISWLINVEQLWMILPGVILGTIKAIFMLEPAAQKNIQRIVTGGNGKCLGGVYSWKTWLFVFLMMGLGGLLRHSSLPNEFLGLFYVSIGWGLLFASRKCWTAWRKEVKKEQ